MNDTLRTWLKFNAVGVFGIPVRHLAGAPDDRAAASRTNVFERIGFDRRSQI
jgi:hypothetical protein